MKEFKFYPFRRLPAELRAKVFDCRFENFIMFDRHVTLPFIQTES
jgi:hypothetical protein